MAVLAAHRKADLPCTLGNASHKEGVSDVEWATLDAQSRKTIKNQESHRTEKWKEIWMILFPGEKAPTPCKHMDLNQHNSVTLNYS
jgi:hypothetical protein